MPIGIDLGSRYTKIVQTEDFKVFRKKRYETVPFLTRPLAASTDQEGFLLNLESLGWDTKGPLVVTGYGKRLVSHRAQTLTEIRAHFRGAYFQTGLKDFILVEMGGQDSKVLLVKESRVMDFQTNDKCAAGTGRYLENMARLLGISRTLLSRESENPIRINNTCAIFGETEIIGLLMEQVPLKRICAGINDSVARRVIQMIRRYPPLPLVVSGGVALNRGMVSRLSGYYGRPVLVPKDPQFNGAIGCCLEGLSLEDIERLRAKPPGADGKAKRHPIPRRI